MINLLPPEFKANIHYARNNVSMIKWLSALGLVLVGIGVITLAGITYIKQTHNLYQNDIARINQNLENQNLEETKTQIKSLSNNINLAISVLSKQILFSELLQQIGAIMPPGTVLQNLSLGELEGAIELSAIATNYESATQVHVNLEDENQKNRIFEESDILQAACPQGDEQNEEPVIYPCQITIRVLFGDKNPFLLLNRGEENE